jgi:hypothetical protein
MVLCTLASVFREHRDHCCVHLCRLESAVDVASLHSSLASSKRSVHIVRIRSRWSIQMPGVRRGCIGIARSRYACVMKFASFLRVSVVLPVLVLAVGCAMSPQAKLEARSESVASLLKREQAKAVALPAGDSVRAAKLSHLTGLHTTMSAANVGLATVPYLLDESQRPTAYSVLREVYETIEWNVPLMPGDTTMKMLPAEFAGGALRLQGAEPGQQRFSPPGYAGQQ